MSITTTAPAAEPETVDAFAERLFVAGLGALELLNIELGCRLGLYHHLADGEGHTPAELAGASRIHERYAREWLEQQTVAGVLTVDHPRATPAQRRYRLPAEHATVLLDRDSEAFMAAFAAFIPVAAAALGPVVDAFRSGEGVPYGAYGIHDIQAAWTRPAFLHHLTQTWLPAVPEAHGRLLSGTARVCEIGCGEDSKSLSHTGVLRCPEGAGRPAQIRRHLIASPKGLETCPLQSGDARGKRSISRTRRLMRPPPQVPLRVLGHGSTLVRSEHIANSGAAAPAVPDLPRGRSRPSATRLHM